MLWNMPAYSLLLYMAFVLLFIFTTKLIVRLNPRFQRKWYPGSIIYQSLLGLEILLCFSFSLFINDLTQSEQNYERLTELALVFIVTFLILDIGLEFILRNQSKRSKITSTEVNKQNN